MDKKASRFSAEKRQIDKHSGLLKSKRMRRLNVVGRVSSSKEEIEMGSDGEDELRSSTIVSKRFKVPRKFWDDCKTVDYNSVPRKLRSAMKKRNRESYSPPTPDSEKPEHAINGVERLRKKSKLNSKQDESNGSLLQDAVGPITKDEEEVVETLYALAEMFPNNDNTKKSTFNNELTQEKSSDMPEQEVSKSKDDSKTSLASITIDSANPSSSLEGSVRERVEVKSLNELSEPCLVNCNQLHLGLDSSAPEVNLRKISIPSMSEATDEKSLSSPLGFNVPSEPSLWSGLKQPKHKEAAACARKMDVPIKPATAVSNQYDLQRRTFEERKNRKNSESYGTGPRGHSLQSTAVKIPAWLGNASSAILCGLSEIDITTKDSKVLGARKKLWKRCATHVYISRLIEALKNSEREDRLPQHPTLLKSDEGSKQGLLIAKNSFNRVRNGLNGVSSVDNHVGSTFEKNSNEVRNAILLQKRLLQDQQKVSTSSGLCSSRNQTFDFLSLSGGEANYNNSGANGLETPSQLHVSYLQPLAQSHTLVPFSQPQNGYSSEITARQVQQLPPYFGSPPHLGVTTAAASQKQQQMFWAAQYKPEGVSSLHNPNLERGRQDSPSLLAYAHSIPRISRTSLEVLGPAYASISLQQPQQLLAMTSPLPSSRLKMQHNRVPFGYEGNGGGFFPESSLSLQLLCNEHL